MALKKIFNKHDDKARRCLKCNAEIEPHILKDNKNYTCQQCGQVHFVDIYGPRVVLTRKEWAEIRRRHKGTPEEEKIKELSARIKELEKELAAAQQNAKEWEAAADGLARHIEELSEKERKAK